MVHEYANLDMATVMLAGRGVGGGIRPDLTPGRMLGLFAEGLAATPAGEPLADSLRQFDREFRDYLIVSQVLQQGGGIGALFGVVGNVKEVFLVQVVA